MRNVLIILVMWMSAMAALPAAAAPQNHAGREQWMNEMRQYKRSYFTKELNLKRDQQERFYPLYEEMEDKMAAIDDDARNMERRVADMKDPSDLELEKATEAMYDADVKRAKLEREYMDRFATILTPRQLFRLKAVERQFNREIMRQHHRLKLKAKKEQK